MTPPTNTQIEADDVVEKVRQAIIAEIKEQTDGQWPHYQNDAGTTGLVSAFLNFEVIARAAIKAIEG